MVNKNIDKYPFEIRKLSDEEGGGYMISFPDFNSCISDGETIEEAIENGKDALDGLITTLRELGRDIPEPGSNTINASGKFMLRLPKSLHASLIKSAKEENVSMNTLAVTLIAQGLAPKNPSLAACAS